MIAQFWPEVPAPSIPDHLPAAVKGRYEQAESNFSMPGNEEAAGSMYRKALEIGLRGIDPEPKGTVNERIERLAKAGRLTPELREWAHEIRHLGNEAVHDDEPPTREELAALRGFSEMVLTYLFTLPGMLAQRRAAKDA